MTQPASDEARPLTRAQAEQHDLRSYLWGLVLALLLTAVPFALVQWPTLALALTGGLPFAPAPWQSPTRGPVLLVVGVLALVQVVVHFRFFLHIGLRRQREDLLLILFSALMLIVMVAGTLWIMGNLSLRMALPGAG